MKETAPMLAAGFAAGFVLGYVGALLIPGRRESAEPAKPITTARMRPVEVPVRQAA